MQALWAEIDDVGKGDWKCYPGHPSRWLDKSMFNYEIGVVLDRILATEHPFVLNKVHQCHC